MAKLKQGYRFFGPPGIKTSGNSKILQFRDKQENIATDINLIQLRIFGHFTMPKNTTLTVTLSEVSSGYTEK